MKPQKLCLVAGILAVIVPSSILAQSPAVERRTVRGFQAEQKAIRTRKAIAELEGPHMKLVEDFWKSKEFKKDSPPQEEYVRISWAFREHLINQAVRVATEVNQRVKEYHKAKIDPAAPAKGEKRDDQFYFPSPQEKSQALQRGEQEAVDTASNVLEIMGRKKLPNLPLSWAVLPDKSVFHGKEVVVITQVVDRQNALAKKVTPSGGEVFFWLAGVPFDNVADGATVEISGVFLVDGTETYNTPRGTNTVKVLRRMPIDASKFYELSEFDKKD